jgi:hypothetical protein
MSFKLSGEELTNGTGMQEKKYQTNYKKEEKMSLKLSGEELTNCTGMQEKKCQTNYKKGRKNVI